MSPLVFFLRSVVIFAAFVKKALELDTLILFWGAYFVYSDVDDYPDCCVVCPSEFCVKNLLELLALRRGAWGLAGWAIFDSSFLSEAYYWTTCCLDDVVGLAGVKNAFLALVPTKVFFLSTFTGLTLKWLSLSYNSCSGGFSIEICSSFCASLVVGASNFDVVSDLRMVGYINLVSEGFFATAAAATLSELGFVKKPCLAFDAADGSFFTPN